MAIIDIPSGKEGTIRVLKEMMNLVNKDMTDRDIIEFTNDIILDIPERDKMKEAERIFKFVRDNIRFVKDPLGKETIFSTKALLNPVRTDTGWILKGRMQGDCDDKSITLATMLQIIGIPTRFVAIKTFDKPKYFSHVFVEGLIEDKWIPFDTITKNDMGWRYPFTIEELYGYPIINKVIPKQGFLSNIGEPFRIIDGIGMLFGNIESIESYSGDRICDSRNNISNMLFDIADAFSGVEGDMGNIDKAKIDDNLNRLAIFASKMDEPFRTSVVNYLNTLKSRYPEKITTDSGRKWLQERMNVISGIIKSYEQSTKVDKEYMRNFWWNPFFALQELFNVERAVKHYAEKTGGILDNISRAIMPIVVIVIGGFLLFSFMKKEE